MRIADELQVDCPVFYIDNVAEYCSHHVVGPSDFPIIAPPFRDMLIEYRARDDDGWYSAAVRIESERYEPADTAAREQLGIPPEVEWVLSTAFKLRDARLGHGLIDGPGVLFGASSEGDFLGWLPSPVEAYTPEMIGQALFFLRPVLLALSFMHCKNVRHVAGEPKGWEARAARKRGKPYVKYYTLEIDPMKETLRREGGIEKVGLAQALHICRGHFKDYRQSGLFGKIKGIFWWGPALRGTPEAGAVVKDYAVKAPQSVPPACPDDTIH